MTEPQKLPSVALVDDDDIYQFISLKSLQAIKATREIYQFLSGDAALKYLREKSGDTQALPDIIFLDINMPRTDGWMFIEEFKKLKANLAKQITIYMVSSSIDQNDIRKAKATEEVADYVFKPISTEKFSSLLNA